FDVCKIENAEAAGDKDVQALMESAEDMAAEDEDAAALTAQRAEEDNDAPFEDDEDWVDEIVSMSEEEAGEFEVELIVVKVLLAKVRVLAFKIVNFPTKLLPAWREICSELGLDDKLIPCNVQTRWNSTYDMAIVTTQYE
ncbi:hypothetical protein K466DRAFT_469601, partial [Polyporus arcularius HHB13444]